MFRVLFLTFCSFLTVLAPVQAMEVAPDPAEAVLVGIFSEVQGDVTIAPPEGTGKSGVVDGQIFMHDTIRTGNDSRVLVEFEDGTEISLGANAELKIDDYIYDPEDGSKNKGRYSVLRGAFLYTSGLMTKTQTKPDVEITTQYGTIGIRGTQFWGGEIDDAYGILVNEGEVYVANEGGRATLSKGMGLALKDKKSAHGMIKRWPETKVKRAVGMIALKNPDNVTKRRDARKALWMKLKENRRDGGPMKRGPQQRGPKRGDRE